jgi:hypothetical protein
MEEHGQHAHPPHRTGHSWLDISLATSAFVVSLASLWLTVHNARTMERLVTSNSYPNIDVNFGNRRDLQDGQGLRPVVYLALDNSGVGPARLRSIEVSFNGRPAENLRALLAICCTSEPVGSLPKTDYWSTWDERGAMLQAGKSVALFEWPEAVNDPRWARLEALRGRIGVRVCYCSVFEECYARDREQREPRRIGACPVPAVPYVGG